MFRLILLTLLLLLSCVQVFIGLDVPSSNHIHYSMMNTYGIQAVRMNQQKVVLGVAPTMRNGFGGNARSFLKATPNNSSNSKVNAFVSSDVKANPASLQSTKNTPVFNASYLDNIARQNHTFVENVENQVSDETKTATVPGSLNQTSTSQARHLKTIGKLFDRSANVSIQETRQENRLETVQESIQETIAFGFGVEASSLIGQLEAAQETVAQELAQSEENAKTHTNIALGLPFVPQELTEIKQVEQEQVAQVESDSNFGVAQKQSLVFEAQSTPGATGGLARSEQPIQQQSSTQSGFEVALTSYAAPTIPTATLKNQKIASNLTDTSTTVVSGLEITLNPNSAIRRETPAEQQAFLWPLPTRGRMTSGYGNRVLAITNNHFHHGIDIAVKTGTPILAVKDGVIEKAGWEGSYGYAVYVQHNDGTETRYAHMSRIIVEKGEWVNQGQWLGLVGSTGLSTGPHLHFELHLSGNPVDPSKHLVFSGERLASR